MTQRDVIRLIEAAPEMTARDMWPEPDMRLIDDERAPAPALYDDALPAGWGEWTAAEAAAQKKREEDERRAAAAQAEQQAKAAEAARKAQEAQQKAAQAEREKARPAPVSTTTRQFGSAAAASRPARSSACMPRVKALSLSGRLSVSRVTPPSRAIKTVAVLTRRSSSIRRSSSVPRGHR